MNGIREKRSTAGLLALLLMGCTVGPDFMRPAAPDVTRYTPETMTSTASTSDVAGGQSQRFLDGEDIPAAWWQLFHSPPLTALVERALKNSPDLKAAEAALTVAHENVLVQRAAYYPSVAGSFAADRSKTAASLSPTPSSGALLFNLFTPEVSVSFVPDVFGLNRRQVESLVAEEQGSRFELIASYLALTANVVVAAIQEASLREQIRTTRDLIAANSKSLDLLRQQQAHGYASRLDVAAEEAQLAQTSATLPPLLKQLAQQRHLLATLSGSLASEDLPEQFELSQLELPQELPLSVPSRLVEQRPDVRQAEANLHAACAQIGVAIANRLPNFNITADAGASALTLGGLTSTGAGFWDLGAQITQPIFQGGALQHKELAARAAYQQAREQYRSAVLTAFQNVADTLAALEHDAEALRAASASAAAARTTLDLVQAQQRGGYASYLQLLNAEQSYQTAVLARVLAQSNRFADTAALFQALGGGWWNRVDARMGHR
ncbi:MAG TPA: efflux transporter outer membrane subunit [Steroidobacteraceae bacterium]|jgi:NodT family efflux transporter outer membrane factor (OMF) lipoprotein|nr:efflux transporter outer membrane subunit [Steroidobacteraceae bacterium]